MCSHVGSVPCGHSGIYLTYRIIVEPSNPKDSLTPLTPPYLSYPVPIHLPIIPAPTSSRKTVALRKVVKNRA